MILRPYQSAASNAVFAEWLEHNSTLVVLPTGGGKTILFADVIRRVFPRRALVIAHREELIFQARDKIQRVTGLRADVEMAITPPRAACSTRHAWSSPRSRLNAPAATAVAGCRSSTRPASAC